MPVSDSKLIAQIEAHLPHMEDAIEKIRPTKPLGKRQTADRRWQIYLLVLAIDTARGLISLLKAGHFRSAVVLARCLYEYRIKAEFMMKDRKEAFRQFSLIPAKVHADLSKLPASDPLTEAHLVNTYLDWRRTAGALAEDYMGDVGVSSMMLKIAEEGEKQTDSGGKPYVPEFVVKYGIPSWLVHGDAVNMTDVFPGWNHDDDWRIRMTSALYEGVPMVALEVLHTLFDHLRVVHTQYNLDFKKVTALARRSLQMRNVIRQEWKRELEI